MGPISHIGLISPISLGAVDYKKWGIFDAIADCEGIFVPKEGADSAGAFGHSE
jgi:hypothetical protein